MGTLVEGQVNSAASQRAVTTVAAGVIVVAVAKIAVFIGTNIAHRHGEAVRRLMQCRDAAVESGSIDTSAFMTRSLNVEFGKGQVVATDGVAVAVLTEDDVAVIWETTAIDGGSSLQLVTEIDVLINTLIEAVLKVA